MACLVEAELLCNLDGGSNHGLGICFRRLMVVQRNDFVDYDVADGRYLMVHGLRVVSGVANHFAAILFIFENLNFSRMKPSVDRVLKITRKNL